ncbi:nitrogenase cofactor biosynthesis protein NifB [Dysgonomonas gadei]|uniref:FeMo cofactor biosynthesis protein NifB n=1 Tax=Dysgonomonas gadei ATCC BAA-286 TaxID=742766 RepID=F5IU62_9BACT|nr:nitrogenase cofactor biosynthesis protein NifB [Dysgonomonas gadei]EGK03241.1 nitrogenase cofactor biosynthesis protein NifB [Dysgonomonas gadei ATCC BAA-286]
MKDLSQHPCFNAEAKHKYARVHLPVAPKCNIQCNYCNRKYDCCNESRPGVTSTILSPLQSVHYMKALSEKIPNISVVGIAGPGDPFANAEETLQTMRLAQKEFPDLIFCLSSNGLDLAPYIDEIAEIGVSHVTITVNSLNPETLAKIYRWVRYKRRVYRGEEGAKVLLEQQLYCIQKLKEKNITVKINTVICPGINDHEIEDLAKKVAELGADTMNCIPMYPTENTEFEILKEPSKEMMKDIKARISKYIKPMAHCARCRADAAGLLGHDNAEAMNMIGQFSSLVVNKGKGRERVAVASNEGLLVNMHLGEARKVYIFEQSKNGYHFVETRNTPPEGTGMNRWKELAEKTLIDCQAILVAGIGETPMRVMQENGVKVIQMNGLIDAGLDAIYLNLPIKTLCRSEYTKCGETCRGTGSGCG